ncbi:hypothetical protein E0504_40210 [Parafrankia sp. BMG5.11]|nr:hypothetical protein E0504_40210 [Parafrankia sp. BMG5.11]
MERLVVHVDEAMRLGPMGDEAHLRLALLMLDSAAELILHQVDHLVAAPGVRESAAGCWERPVRGLIEV